MKKPTILFIDDEQAILYALKSQLIDSLGQLYALETAENGNNALEIIHELLNEGREIPLVVVDYLMPGMRGDQVLINIHNLSPSTLCIMLTGQADLSAVANAINHEAMFRFMSKPWNKEDLLKTVYEAFHRHELEKSIIEKKQLLETQNMQLIQLNDQLIEKMKIFYQFVPAEFLKILNANLDHIALDTSCQREIVVVFTDIRGFTDASQNFTNEETFNFINSFTKVISPIIAKHHGFIDKFIGDAVMSIFLNVDDSLNAIFESLEAFSVIPIDSCIHNLKLGFSLNYGPVQMGTVGCLGRMETTVLGKIVNIAAKLEKLNKKYNTNILLTEAICNQADKNKFLFNLIDETNIQGIKEPIKLFSVSKIKNEDKI